MYVERVPRSQAVVPSMNATRRRRRRQAVSDLDEPTPGRLDAGGAERQVAVGRRWWWRWVVGCVSMLQASRVGFRADTHSRVRLRGF